MLRLNEGEGGVPKGRHAPKSTTLNDAVGSESMDEEGREGCVCVCVCVCVCLVL